MAKTNTRLAQEAYKDHWRICKDKLLEYEWVDGWCRECGADEPNHDDDCELAAILAVDLDIVYTQESQPERERRLAKIKAEDEYFWNINRRIPCPKKQSKND